MNTNILDKFVGKNVEIHTAHVRFCGLLENIEDDHILMLPIVRYDRIHYGNQIILSESIIAIREIIPELHLTKEELKCKEDEEDSEI